MYGVRLLIDRLFDHRLSSSFFVKSTVDGIMDAIVDGMMDEVMELTYMFVIGDSRDVRTYVCTV